MSFFYGFYVTLNGLLLALSLSVNVIENHKMFWGLVDTLAPAYLCLLNRWSRNKLLYWANRLQKKLAQG
jgi:hypothetical protein